MPDFTTDDGLRIYYQDEGAGQPILCLSGLTRTGRDFDYVAPHLSEFRVIRMDYRGRGASDWGDHRSYTILREAQDALQLLDHLGVDAAAILGTSRGGLIAMVIAVMDKARLTGVCLNDIGPELDPKGLGDIATYLGRKPTAKTLAEAVNMRAALSGGFANVPTARWEAEVALHYRQTEDGLDITYDPALRDAVLGARTQPEIDLWPMFDAFDGLPLALIRGENSNLLRYETAQKMAQRRPDMIWAEVPDRGHVPFLDEPASLAALKDWSSHL